jgi:phospholipase/carboxylesterase
VTSVDLVHAAYVPAGDGPHPAIVALHGWGANALDLLGLAPHLTAGRSVVLCPQGPIGVPLGGGLQGYGWFPLSLGAPPDAVACAAALDALERFVAGALTHYAVAPERVALLGFSQGGVMAYGLAGRRRMHVAALAALSTWFVPGLVQVEPGSFQGLPVLVQHGMRDELIAVDRGREAVERLRALRADVVYREYDIGHEIGAQSLRDLDAFLAARLPSCLLRGHVVRPASSW